LFVDDYGRCLKKGYGKREATSTDDEGPTNSGSELKRPWLPPPALVRTDSVDLNAKKR